MARKKSKLSEEALEARRRWQREWRAKNKDKVKLYNQRYWQKKADQYNEAVGCLNT